jgi:opacity protein-like surface antigen
MIRSSLIALAAVTVFAAPVMAADLLVAEPASQPAMSSSEWYLSLHVGGVSIAPVETTFVYGGPNTGDVSSDYGYRLGGAVGVELSDNVAIEGELSYATVNLSEFDYGVGTDSVEGTAATTSLMANFVLGTDMGGLRPYVGVGAGAVNVSLDIPELVFGGGDALNDNDWTWGAQVFAGLEVPVGENDYLGARYRYQRIGDTSFNDDNSDPVSLGTIDAQSAELTLRFSL